MIHNVNDKRRLSSTTLPYEQTDLVVPYFRRVEPLQLYAHYYKKRAFYEKIIASFSRMAIQLALRGVEGMRLTGDPQTSFFSSRYCSCSKYLIKFKENQFLSSVGYGYQQVCKVKYHGDIALKHFIKIILPSLFVPTYGWCYPEPSTRFQPTMYLLDSTLNVIKTLTPKDVTVYYNTVQKFWVPSGIRLNGLRFELVDPPPQCVAIGFEKVDHALFWGFKNYDLFNKYYIFKRTVPNFSIDNSGWINSYSKYLRQYKNNVCAELIERVDLIVGGQLIESITSEFFSIYKNVFVPRQLEKSLQILEGGQAVPTFSDVNYYMYIPFSIESIPLCALTRHEVEIQVQFRKFTDLLDPRYLNDATITVPNAANVLYDGTNVYTVNDKSILARGNVYTVHQNTLDKIDPRTNTLLGSFDLKSLSRVKTTSGFIEYNNSYYNFTPNGTVQKINSGEFYIGAPIRTVYLFSDVLFVTNATQTYIINFIGQILETYPFYGTPNYYFPLGNVLYFKTERGFYVYTPSQGISQSDGSFILRLSTGEYLFLSENYKNFNIRYIFNLGNFVILSTPTETYRLQLTSFQTINTLTNPLLGISIRTHEYIDTYALCIDTNDDIYKITSTECIKIDSNCKYISKKSYMKNDLSIYSITLQSTPSLYTISPLDDIFANTIAYDGQYIYIPPSNGKDTLFTYNLNEPFDDSQAYRVLRYPNMRITASTVDEYRLFMMNSNSIITYSQNAFSEIDYVELTDGRQNYSPEKIVDVLSIDNRLHMFSSNGIYRYDTSISGNSVVPNNFPHSNALCAFSNPVTQSVYFVSSRPSIDGIVKMTSNFSYTVIQSNYPPNEVYGSYTFKGSSVILSGTNLLTLSMTNPELWSAATLRHFSSNTLVTAGSNVYLFPRSQVYSDGTILEAPQIPLNAVTSAVYDGSKFIYATDGSKLTRFNTTLDIFTDLSGYDEFSTQSNLKYGPWERYKSNVTIFGSTVRLYNTLSNTYTSLQTVPDTPLCASYVQNGPVYAFASSSNVYTSDGNVIPMSNVTSLCITSSNLVCMSYSSYSITDRNRDILGTGSYEVFSHPFSIQQPNAVVQFNSNIYIMSKNLISVSVTTGVWSNIVPPAATNVYGNVYIYNSNIYVLPSIGNNVFWANGVSVLGTIPLVDSNISGAYGTQDGKLYFSSYTGSNIQQYTNGLINTYTVNDKTLGVTGYAQNIYFITDTSNVIIYKTQSQNFTNQQTYSRPDTLPLGTIASYQNYILTRNGYIYKIDVDSYSQIPIFDILNPGIYGYGYLSGDIIYRDPREYERNLFIVYIYTRPGDVISIVDDTRFYLTLDGPVIGVLSPSDADLNDASKVYTNYTFTHTGPDESFQKFRFFFQDQLPPKTRIIRDGTQITNDIFIAPTTNPFKFPFSNISSTGYMTTTNASVFFKCDGTVLLRWTPVPTFYKYYGTVTPFNTTIHFADQTEIEVRARINSIFQDVTNITISGAQVTVSRNIIGTSSESFTLSQRSSLFSPSFRVARIYSTDKYTYVFGNPTTLYVFENNSSGKVTSLPIEHYNITQIDVFQHVNFAITTTMYIVVNGYTDLWRFDEETTTFVKIGLPIPMSSQNFSMFSIPNGICILYNRTLYSFGINKNYSNVNALYTNDQKYATYIPETSNIVSFETSGKINIIPGISKTYDVKNATIGLTKNATLSGFQYTKRNGDTLVVRETSRISVIDFVGNSIVATPSVSWSSNVIGIIDNTISFVPGSDTMNVMYIFNNTSYKPYTVRSFDTPIVRISYSYSNIYMYSNTVRRYDTSNDSSSIIAGPYPDTILFYTNVYSISYSNIYLPDGTIRRHSETPTQVLDAQMVQKYLVLTQPSRFVHFDTENGDLLVHPLTIQASVYGNIYVNTSNITVYTSNPYSKLTYTTPEKNCKGVFQSDDGTIYFMSNTTMYPSGNTALGGSTALRTIFDGSNIYYVYTRGTDLDIYYNGTQETIANCTPVSVSVDQFTVYTSNVNTIHRLKLSTGELDVNTDGIHDVDVSVAVGSNLYMHTTQDNLIRFNSTNDPYVEYTLGAPMSCLGFASGNLYIQTQSNIITYTSSSIFTDSQSYTRKKTISFSNYKQTFENYFVSDTVSNTLVTFDGTPSSILSYGNVLVRDVQGQLYFANNVPRVTKYTNFPSETKFSNIIHFTNQTTVNKNVFDGKYIYTLTSDGVYKINISDYADKEYVIPTSLIIDPRVFQTGYFDGRYVACTSTDSSLQIDTLPFVYPTFVSPSIISEYAYIDEETRNKLINQDEFILLVRQLQRAELSESNLYYRVDFLNMLRELIVYPKDGIGNVKSLEMYLNGHLKVNVTGDYMKNQMMLLHTKVPSTNVYSYSFCSDPERIEPSGHLNASRIREKTLHIEWEGADTISVYGVTYNIFKIKHGLSGLVFNSSSRVDV